MFYKGEIPFVRLTVPLVAGIVMAYYCSNETVFAALPPLILSAFVLLLLLALRYRTLLIFRTKWVTGLLIHCILVGFGYWHTVNSSGRFSKTHFTQSKADAFIVEVQTEPKLSGSTLRLAARVDRSIHRSLTYTEGNILVSIATDPGKPLNLKYGDLLLLPPQYDSIPPPYNPGEFNYKQYLADRQIFSQMFIRSDQFYTIGREQGNAFISFALELRKQLVNKFYRYIPDKGAAAFASTLILGYRAELSSELVEAYSKTGTMHVLSVSGMHVGIVFLVLSALLRFMNKTLAARVVRAVIIISLVWFYALLTGFSAPACRAAVMLSFIVLGKALNKSQNTYNLIAISAFFLMLYNPFYLMDAGFQLSYFAVIGLVYYHPKIYQLFYLKNKALDHIWSYSALSLAAQLGTFPLSIYYFHQFPVYFLISNLLIVIPVAVIMYYGLIFLFIPFEGILESAGWLLGAIINFTNEILFYIENLPFSSWEGIWIDFTQCILIFALLIIISMRLATGFKKLNLPLVTLVLLLCLSISLSWIKKYDRTQLVFYNLKRKSGLAYIHHDRSIIVTDVDPNDKQFNFLILPAVKKQGSRQQEVYNETENFSGKTYIGCPNFYQFGSCRIVKWDKNFDDTRFSVKLAVDLVLVSGNPRAGIREIASLLEFKQLIIDANNPEYKIKTWVEEARLLGCKYYVLKKNPALVITL